jgi:hypothetical protein
MAGVAVGAPESSDEHALHLLLDKLAVDHVKDGAPAVHVADMSHQQQQQRRSFTCWLPCTYGILNYLPILEDGISPFDILPNALTYLSLLYKRSNVFATFADVASQLTLASVD